MADHGTVTSYQNGCHCQPCKDGRAAYMREHRAATGDPYGKARKAAIAQAAYRYRDEHPDEWRDLLKEQIKIFQQRVEQQQR